MKDNVNTTNTNTTIEPKTFDELVNSHFCMMYFARGCKRNRRARGLCNSHYHMIRSLVENGVITWEKVELQLKALPLQKKESLKSLMESLGVKN